MTWPGRSARRVQGLAAFRNELLLFLVCLVTFTAFSGSRFLRQSAAPHFVYQAKAWLDGRLDIDPAVLPNLEDWACVREVAGEKQRCTYPPRGSDRWYVSFPPFPAVVMLPFVAVNGYELNDTSFTVFVAALAVASFYALLRALAGRGQTGRSERENAALALLFGFGTLFFYCAIRGEVWFTAQVMGTLFSIWYVRVSLGAERPLLAGALFSAAVLTRTPLLFTGIFFVLECARRHRAFRDKLAALVRFGAGALPMAVLAGAYNLHRFGAVGEFGHRFLFENRVNAGIDRYGLFNLRYLARNLEAAWLKLPMVERHPLGLTYDPHGMSLLLTFPLLVLLFGPRERRSLQWPLAVTALACALPGLLYQNTGYMQFGFRFSLDYTPHLLLLFAVSGWRMTHPMVLTLATLAVLVNGWGALVFRGYTEYVRGR